MKLKIKGLIMIPTLAMIKFAPVLNNNSIN